MTLNEARSEVNRLQGMFDPSLKITRGLRPRIYEFKKHGKPFDPPDYNIRFEREPPTPVVTDGVYSFVFVE